MRVLATLAWRLAYSADARQRWRQISVIGSTFVGVLALLLAASVITTTTVAAQHQKARTPVFGESQAASFQWKQSAASVDGQQFPIVWLQPREGAPVPPGLTAFPRPGSVTLSPGLRAVGVEPRDLGLADGASGSGVGGVIGDEGLRASSEMFAYAVPASGRAIDGQPMAGWGSPAGVGVSDGFSPIPSANEALVTCLWALVAPSLFLLVGAARASSSLRRQRSRFLYRQGATARRVRVLMAVEAGMLAAPGAVAGVLTWAFWVRPSTTLPLTQTTLLPNSLAVPWWMALAVSGCAVGLVAVASMMMRVAGAQISVVRRPPGLWSVIPLALSLAMMAGAAMLDARSSMRLPLLFGGLLLALGGIPLGLPHLTARLGTLLSRQTAPRRWLAGRRLETASMTLSRPAAAVAALIFISGSAVALYDRMEASLSVVPRLHEVSGYSITWPEARPGDIAAVERAFGGDVVAPVADGTAYFRDCAELAHGLQVAHLAVTACDSHSPQVTRAARHAFSDSLGVAAAVATAPQGARQVIVLQQTQGADLDAMRSLGGVVPAPNVEPFYANSRSSGTTRHWVIAAWSAASLLLVLSLIRDICDRVSVSLREDRTIARIGISASDQAAVQRYAVLTPLLLAVPIGIAGSIAFALVGNQLGVTLINTAKISALGVIAGVMAAAGLVVIFWLHRKLKLTA